jgi:polyvinyl alcohol dehydrogenase (cytochrome)
MSLFLARRLVWVVGLRQFMVVLAALATVVTSFSAMAVNALADARTGDWTTYLAANARSGFNASETTIAPSTASDLTLRWTAKDTGTASGANEVASQPVVANGLVYWGDWSGLEHATDSSTGLDVWSAYLGFSTDPCPDLAGVSSTGTVASEPINGTATSVLYVGGGDGQVYALNAQSGAVIWHTPLPSQPDAYIWSSPAVYNGSVYVGLASLGDCPEVQGQLIQLNASDGSIQHTFNVVPSGCTGGGVWGSPTIDEAAGMIYIATGNEGTCGGGEPYTDAIVKLRASDLAYQDSWQVPASQQVNDGDFGSTPTLFTATINGTIHSLVGVASKNGIYYAWDRSSLNSGPVWEDQIAVGGPEPTGGEGSIAPSGWDGSSLYVAGGSTTINGQTCAGSVRAVNPADGSYIWRACLNGMVLGAVTVVPGIVEVGAGHQLVLLSAISGATLYSYTLAGSTTFWAAGSVANGVLYQGDTIGRLYAFAPASLPAPPAAPASLTATAASSSQVNLSWTNNATNADSYTVERSLDGSTWTVVTSSLPGSATSYSDTGLSPATTYYYRVKATNAGGSSGYSNTANATTPAAYATDSFTRTVSGGWGTPDFTSAPGLAWQPTSGPSTAFSVGPDFGGSNGAGEQVVSGAGRSRQASLAINGQNVSATVRVAADQVPAGGNINAYIYLRYIDDYNWYRLGVTFSPNKVITLNLEKRTGNSTGYTDTNLVSQHINGLSYAANTYYWVKFQVQSTSPTATTLQGKIWPDGTTEPASFQVNYNGDTTPALQTAGSLGLRSYLGSGYTGTLPVSYYWDDLTANTLTAT